LWLKDSARLPQRQRHLTAPCSRHLCAAAEAGTTKYEIVINLKTAKTLSIEVPAQLLALVDELIE
jgi:hypothetical protein